MLVGGGISLLIETLQFFLNKGFAEFDDVWHNTIGCVIGFYVLMIFAMITKSIYAISVVKFSK